MDYGAVLLKLTLRWPVVLIAFVITFSFIYAANYWRQENLVKEPLREQLLSLENVDDVEIYGRKEQEISISLGPVPKLATAYRDIQAVLQSHDGGTARINIQDQRDPYLISVYEKIHFALMEGERQGNYTEMNAKIDLLLNEEKKLTSYSLTVDQDRIYLQLNAGEHYLYEIISLTNSSTTEKIGGLAKP